MARLEKDKLRPRLGRRPYLGPNDFIADFGRVFDADSGNDVEKFFLCVAWPLGGFKVGNF